MTKTAKAVQAFQQGLKKEALRIAQTFRIGLSTDERKALSLGYECLVRPDFYRQLGKNPEQLIARAEEVFKLKFI